MVSVVVLVFFSLDTIRCSLTFLLPYSDAQQPTAAAVMCGSGCALYCGGLSIFGVIFMVGMASLIGHDYPYLGEVRV